MSTASRGWFRCSDRCSDRGSELGLVPLSLVLSLLFLLLFLLFPASGCGGGATSSAACNGARPALGDCFVGEFFAECGGTGTPTFACTGSDCRWFVDGCVAAGYDASSCAADNVCCLDNAPFAAGEGGAWEPAVYSHGRSPWDRTRAMNVAVSVDPTLASVTPTVMCTGTYPNVGTPCTDPPIVGLAMDDTFVLSLTSTALFGWNLVVEAVQDPMNGVITARVCQLPYTDSWSSTCTVDQVLCANEGFVEISRWPTGESNPTGVGATIDVYFGSNRELRVQAAF